MNLKIKICGIKAKQNFEELHRLDVDMIGLNFYPASSRYLDRSFDLQLLHNIPKHIEKAGVFVNASKETIEETAKIYGLDYIQLHGNEKPELGIELKKKGYKLIKACQIHSDIDWNELRHHSYASFFLLDSRSKQYGGSGKKFDWHQLADYPLNKPFMLSGGIGPEDFKLVSKVTHPMCMGIDINSRFEQSPGHKDLTLILDFLYSLRIEKSSRL